MENNIIYFNSIEDAKIALFEVRTFLKHNMNEKKSIENYFGHKSLLLSNNSITTREDTSYFTKQEIIDKFKISRTIKNKKMKTTPPREKRNEMCVEIDMFYKFRCLINLKK